MADSKGSGSDDADVEKEFSDAVNMTASALDRWLGTDESKSVGDSSGGGESTGHASGRRIVEILHGKKSERSDADR